MTNIVPKYQRIYNKVYHQPNGTLIANWFEEEELRKYTGESRSIPFKNFPRKMLDFESEPVTNPYAQNDTFKRIISSNENERSFNTTYNTYGNFQFPESKYNYEGINEKQFSDYAKEKLNQKPVYNNNIYANDKTVSYFQTTNKSDFIPQPLPKEIGSRRMFTQDKEKVENQGLLANQLFTAQHDMGKYPGAISKEEIKQYIDNNVPYYNDKEITFWSMNSGKGNVYRSSTAGNNAFGRTHGFTQGIDKSRSAYLYNGNVRNNPNSKNICFNTVDYDRYQNFKNYYKEKEEKSNLDPLRDLGKISQKFLEAVRLFGWTGLRELKLFLKGFLKSDLIERTEFKYNLINFGIKTLTEEDINFLYEHFDKNKSNRINYCEVFDILSKPSQERLNLILQFYDRVNPKKEEFIKASYLERITDMNYFPEVLKLMKDGEKAFKDYITTWGHLKEDDLITKDNFIKYFSDISACFASDDDFKQCLYALGLR